MSQAKTGDASGVREVLLAMADCLDEQPDQFNFVLNVHVDKIVGLEAGFGSGSMSFNATNSGVAENVIGGSVQSTASASDFKLEQGAASDELRGRSRNAARLLRELADELGGGGKSASRIKDKLTALADIAIPAIVVETTRRLLRLLGLPV